MSVAQLYKGECCLYRRYSGSIFGGCVGGCEREGRTAADDDLNTAANDDDDEAWKKRKRIRGRGGTEERMRKSWQKSAGIATGENRGARSGAMKFEHPETAFSNSPR